MTVVFADTLYWVAITRPSDPWAPAVEAVGATLGTTDAGAVEAAAAEAVGAYV